MQRSVPVLMLANGSVTVSLLHTSLLVRISKWSLPLPPAVQCVAADAATKVPQVVHEISYALKRRLDSPARSRQARFRSRSPF